MDKSPHDLAEERLVMASMYSTLSEELAVLLDKEAEFWKLRRDDFKSDASCTKAWAVTDSGRRQTAVKLKLKALEKQLSAHRSMLDVLQGEARNQW